MLHADNVYHLPDIQITSHRLRTNTQSATAYRGFGGPQGIVGIERVMDHITVYLEFNPLVVHQKNFYALRAGGILGKKKGGRHPAHALWSAD